MLLSFPLLILSQHSRSIINSTSMLICSTMTAEESVVATTTSMSFSFTTLPGELRHEIYRQYLGCWDAVIEYDRKTARFVLKGKPEYSLMLTNRKTHVECRYLVPKSFSGHLVVRDTKVCRERGFGFVSSFDEIVSLCPSWLLRQVSILSIDQGTSGMLMSLPWSSLDSLREVHLQNNSLPIAYYYPCEMTPGSIRSRWQHIVEGVYDTWCLNGHKYWSQVPRPVLDGKVRVLTQRKGAVRGVALKIWVEHKSDTAEVVCRMVEPLR